MQAIERWYSERIQRDITLRRWGHWGTPVLVFPTAGGDAGEIERNGLIEHCAPLIENGRVKIYSCDSVAGRVMMTKEGSPAFRMRLLNLFHQCVRHEIVPAIRADSGGSQQLIVTAGASIGAFNAIAVMCRYPDVFAAAVGMSGSYRLEQFYEGQSSEDLYFASPNQFLEGLGGPTLDLLRQRFAIIASGQGAYENLGESWAMAEALGRKGIPNRVDPWGEEWPHEWFTWHRMLPVYLDELC